MKGQSAGEFMDKGLLDKLFREIEKDYPLGEDQGRALIKIWPTRWRAIKIELQKLLNEKK